MKNKARLIKCQFYWTCIVACAVYMFEAFQPEWGRLINIRKVCKLDVTRVLFSFGA